jgi:hypothetical protein
VARFHQQNPLVDPVGLVCDDLRNFTDDRVVDGPFARRVYTTPPQSVGVVVAACAIEYHISEVETFFSHSLEENAKRHLSTFGGADLVALQ